MTKTVAEVLRTATTTEPEAAKDSQSRVWHPSIVGGDDERRRLVVHPLDDFNELVENHTDRLPPVLWFDAPADSHDVADGFILTAARTAVHAQAHLRHVQRCTVMRDDDGGGRLLLCCDAEPRVLMLPVAAANVEPSALNRLLPHVVDQCRQTKIRHFVLTAPDETGCFFGCCVDGYSAVWLSPRVPRTKVVESLYYWLERARLHDELSPPLEDAAAGPSQQQPHSPQQRARAEENARENMHPSPSPPRSPRKRRTDDHLVPLASSPRKRRLDPEQAGPPEKRVRRDRERTRPEAPLVTLNADPPFADARETRAPLPILHYRPSHREDRPYRCVAAAVRRALRDLALDSNQPLNLENTKAGTSTSTV